MKILKYLLIAVVVLVLGAVGTAYFSLNTLIKKAFETGGPAVAKVETKLGSAQVLPFSGSGKLSNLFIGNPEKYKTPHAIKVDEIAVKLDVASLKTDKIVIESIKVHAPDIYIEGGLTDKNNLTAISHNIAGFSADKAGKPEAKEKSAKTEKPDKPAKKVVIKDLVITGGKVHWVSTLTLGQEVLLPLPDIHLQNIGEEKKGISLSEVTQLITNELLKNAKGVSVKNAGKALEGLKETGTENLNKAAEGLKGLLKR